jgi:voltage-gated potassium channel
MGKVIYKELKHKGIQSVIVEKESRELDVDDDVMMIYGDATRDDLLKSVGIERAKGLISVLDSDAQNLYVVLSARGLNKKLFIVARANEEGADYKLTRAGADKVAVIGEPEHFTQFEKMAMGKRKSVQSDKTSTPLPEF